MPERDPKTGRFASKKEEDVQPVEQIDDTDIELSKEPEVTLTPEEIELAIGGNPNGLSNEEKEELEAEEQEDDDDQGLEPVEEDDVDEDDGDDKWWDEDYEALAKLHNIPTEELDNISGPEEFSRLLKYSTRGEKKEADGDDGSDTDGDASSDSDDSDDDAEDKSLTKIDPADYAEEFDDDEHVVKLAKAVEELQRRLEEQGLTVPGQQQIIDEQRQAIDSFNGEVDKIGGDTFGSSKSLSQEQADARQKLLDSTREVLSDMQQAGQDISQMPVDRAVRLGRIAAFGADGVAMQDDSRVAAARQQASKRRKAGNSPKSRKAQSRRDESGEGALGIDEEAKWIASQLDLTRFS